MRWRRLCHEFRAISGMDFSSRGRTIVDEMNPPESTAGSRKKWDNPFTLCFALSEERTIAFFFRIAQRARRKGGGFPMRKHSAGFRALRPSSGSFRP
jgi:hypothetical protein